MESSAIVEGQVTARGRKVAVVAARFNDFIVSSLLKGAVASWLEHGGAAEDLLVEIGRASCRERVLVAV